jgi:hypothetical protein
MSEKKESRISEVSPEEDDFRIYCKRVGIPESQLMAARDVFDALVEAVLNLFARASGQALPEGLDVLLGRNCTTQPAAPSSSTLQALDAAVKDEIRRSLRPLATRMRLHDFKVLESELLEYPLSPSCRCPCPEGSHDAGLPWGAGHANERV